MLKQRILTAMILVPLVLVVVIYMQTAVLALILAVIVGLGAWEWTKIAGITSLIRRGLFVAVVMLMLAASWCVKNSVWSHLIITAGVIWWMFAAFIVYAAQRQVFEMAHSRVLYGLIGLIVLIPAWLGLILLHQYGQQGRMLLILLLVIVWGADIAAYFTGRRWGKTRLASHISPGKSWEGVYGALLATVIISLPFAMLTGMQLIEIIMFVLLSVLTVVASIIGDLLESLMKRRANLKDSGSLLPGHGGVLDRVDSLTAASPIFVAGLSLSGIGL